ncbi:MAG: hypothetical protein ABSG41_05270 [Bryobacteraceae bacterium]|jgi:hypothetical protein
MPCPLFLPASPLAGFTDFHGGECAAQPGALIPLDTLRRCCNTGYARATCEHAAQSDADAFRFLIKSNRDGVVGVAWSIERDHHPVAVGTFLVTSPFGVEGPLERQARACAAAYFRQNHT